MKPILEIREISKKFRIRHNREPYLSIRDSLGSLFRGGGSSYEDFYALKDVSFDVYPGESIGIIGKNGAGKSTLLKILSKITPPTSGRILSRGRIASLLEVGTGFHPELTGRENVYLNGSILGMKRREIAACFDEIIEFSGTEKFLDTPLKYYSSGMHLRLAFSVAAFLEPEILIIDEVLAVGDSEFQKKCLGKMEDVSKSGRTVLFVSHNMAAIETLCKKSVMLQKGRLVMQGDTQSVIAEYLNNSTADNHFSMGVVNCQRKLLKKVELSSAGKPVNYAAMGAELTLRFHFETSKPFEFPVIGVVFKDSHNYPVLGINNKHYNSSNLALKPFSKGVMELRIPYLTLMSGNYSADVYVGNAFTDHEVIHDCFHLTVEQAKFTDSMEMPEERVNSFFIKDVTWKLSEA
jgi:lipopolysaccharide transport system ATP-binding protein